MKHTPGPWGWYDRHEKALLSGGDKDKNQCYPVIMIVDADGHRSPQEADKNLIAAAPELEDGLLCTQEFLAGLIHGEYKPDKIKVLAESHWNANQKAIAKAKGE